MIAIDTATFSDRIACMRGEKLTIVTAGGAFSGTVSAVRDGYIEFDAVDKDWQGTALHAEMFIPVAAVCAIKRSKTAA